MSSMPSSTKNKIFALVDCNNFYASCERVFRPDLKNTPIVILSNNDGCIISRSNEAKKLGVPMGAPYFKNKELILKNNIQVFSSNYNLYGDMSARVMNSLRIFCPDMEIYSIDEAFLRLDKMAIASYENYAHEICTSVKKWTGIPISIGLAPTKTLAKLANLIAKNNPEHQGVFNLCDKNFDETLKKISVGEIWGIGKNSVIALNKINIFTIYDLKNSQAKLIRKTLSVVGEKIFLELNGVSCLGLEEVSSRKQIIASRSFGEKQTKFEPIAEAVSNYVNHACEKLRSQKSRAGGLCVYIRTHFYNLQNCYSNSHSIHFETPQSDSRIIGAKARECLEKIFKEGFRYHKAGIILFDIHDENKLQENLFDVQDHKKNDRLMKLMDEINESSKSEILFLASQGVKRNWQMKNNLRSNCYTRWEEMLKVS